MDGQMNRIIGEFITEIIERFVNQGMCLKSEFEPEDSDLTLEIPPHCLLAKVKHEQTLEFKTQFTTK